MSKSKNHYSLRAFISYLSNYKMRIGIVFFSFVLADIFIALVPLFVGKLVGVLSNHPIDQHAAWVYVIILIACSAAHQLWWQVCEFLYVRLCNPLPFKYENILFHQVITKPYPYFIDKFTGKISSYITTLSQELRDQLEKLFWDYTNHVVTLVTVIVILIALSWQSGLVFLSSIILMFIVGRLTVRNSIQYEKVWTDVQATKNAKIIDAIANFVNVKSFQKDALEYGSIVHQQDKTIASARRSFIWGMFFWGSMGYIVRLVLWPVMVTLNVYLYIHHQISLATLTTFLASVLLFSDYVWNIIWNVSQFTLKLARMDEAYGYLFGSVNIMEEYEQQKNSQNNIEFASSLHFNNLHFAYPDQADDSVLKDINLVINKGEKIGVVGKSGSGKSTLTKLMLGYYPLEAGQIILDDEPIETKDLAQLVSYVPQDTSLFHRSIAENIAYATDEEVTRNDIVEAAKQAYADEFIMQIPEKYEALVGERGVKLSVGQRQRIAIARAFLDDKSILILDEATSALDSESELLVQQALEALWKDKTVLAIAHRLSTLRHMDRIIVMDNGRIVEEGTHKQLLDQKGEYAKLWSHQSGGFIED